MSVRRVALLALALVAGCVGGHVANEIVVDPIQAAQQAKVDGVDGSELRFSLNNCSDE